jgi:hypothetical protein
LLQGRFQYKVVQCRPLSTNASGDLSDLIKGKCFPTSMNATDYDIPELLVFIQEDQQQYVKYICIEKEVFYRKKSDMNSKSDINLKR